MKRKSKFQLEAFVKTLIRLREARGISQGVLQKQTEETLGQKGGAKIISLWETGVRKKPDLKKYEFVRTLDTVLGAEGTLSLLYEQPPQIIEVERDEMIATSISVVEERKRVWKIRVTKFLPDELAEHPKATDWIEGWTAFLLESKFEMTDNTKQLIQLSLILLES